LTIKVPVYSDQFGYHQINVWMLAENGFFHRTAQWLMPHLLINFKDLSESLGEVVAPAYDRQHHRWETPTAYNYMGRPSSLYSYLRGEAQKRRVMVLTTTGSAGRAYKFTINELRFKNNVSTAVKVLTCRSFMEAIDVFLQFEQQQADAGETEVDGIEVSHLDGDAASGEFSEALYLQSRGLAEQGDANAQYTLGYMLERGDGVAQDASAALRWYLEAARNNHLPAQVRLGSLYALGRGAPQNDLLATFWFDRVAKGGSASAQRLCERFAARLSPAKKAALKQLERDWAKQAG